MWESIDSFDLSVPFDVYPIGYGWDHVALGVWRGIVIHNEHPTGWTMKRNVVLQMRLQRIAQRRAFQRVGLNDLRQM